MQVNQSRLQQQAGEFQYGLGGQAGAPQVVRQVRAAMQQSPYSTFVGVDCKNAFGTLSRSAVTSEADVRVPQVSALLRAMWEGASPRMLIRQADGSLSDFPVVDGLAQGDVIPSQLSAWASAAH